VRVAAPATEGKANRELVAFLAESLRVPRSNITLIKGESSRHKLVEIDGLEEDEVQHRLSTDA
jgi:uncharacterized protein